VPSLTALLVSRYRAFAGDEVLPLRPITLLYGRNNSGKSALSRAFTIIGASVSENAPSALIIPPEVLRGGAFTDLAWQGEAGDYSFDFELRWSVGDVRAARYTLDGSAGRAPYVKELTLRGPDGQILWTGRAAPGRAMRSATGGQDVWFTGLVPRDVDTPPLASLRDNLTALRGRVLWLDGVRARPPRTVIKTGITPTQLAPDGSNAAEFLVEMPEVVEAIRGFYLSLTPPRELDVKDVLDVGHRIRLGPATQPRFSVDLLDTGEGMAQVLPVLVAAELAARTSAILIIEEAESHLHPDAQTILAQYLCNIAARPHPPTIIMETHSRVFLLGVQLAVAAKTLPNHHVQLAWVDQDDAGRSTITAVELADTGHPLPGWPVSALNEDFRLAAQLAKVTTGNQP
jgi:hypothetical protein